MSRGMTAVNVLGNVTGRIQYANTHSGAPVCSFDVISDRHGKGEVVSVLSKINVYSSGLVDTCRRLLQKGQRVLVVGELMNRDGQLGLLMEIRAREVFFLKEGEMKDGGEQR